jgi:hypothetical protein
LQKKPKPPDIASIGHTGYFTKAIFGLFYKEFTHHAHIFMLKVMTMIHETPLVIFKGFDDANALAWRN